MLLKELAKKWLDKNTYWKSRNSQTDLFEHWTHQNSYEKNATNL